MYIVVVYSALKYGWALTVPPATIVRNVTRAVLG